QDLRRELRTAREVRHPHILPFLGLAIVNSHPVLISPFMRNADMMNYLQDNPSVDRTVLIVQAAEAVYYLHATHRLVHGDLKAENVLISDDGRVLLADFGLSTFIDRVDETTRTITAARSRYTVQFAAPELLASEEFVNELPSKTRATDVYAFGMMVLQV
ncbi:kinase-like protein, partial [Auricularia subglabra TFB-10046 SS5]